MCSSDLEVLRMRAAHLLTEDQFRGLYVSDEQVDAVLYGSAPAAGAPEIEILTGRLAEIERYIAGRLAACRSAGIALPLERLTQLYSLSQVERDALLLSVTAELDSRFETLFSYVQNDVTRKRPTAGLILRLLGSSVAERLRMRAIFSADGALVRTPLVRFCEEPQEREMPLLSRPVRPEERIIDFLLEQPQSDSRIRSFTLIAEPRRRLESLHLPRALAEGLRHAAGGLRESGGILFFHGPTGAGKRSAAEAISAEAGRGLVMADLGQAQAAGISMPLTLALLRREARLREANLLLIHAGGLLPEDAAQRGPSLPAGEALSESIDGSGLILFVASESAWPQETRALRCQSAAFEFPIPGVDDRRRLWEEAMEAAAIGQQPDVAGSLADRFALTGGQIHGACRMARTVAMLRGEDSSTLTKADFAAAAQTSRNCCFVRVGTTRSGQSCPVFTFCARR